MPLEAQFLRRRPLDIEASHLAASRAVLGRREPRLHRTMAEQLFIDGDLGSRLAPNPTTLTLPLTLAEAGYYRATLPTFRGQPLRQTAEFSVARMGTKKAPVKDGIDKASLIPLLRSSLFRQLFDATILLESFLE